MRLAEEDVKVLYKIVENTTIDELLEEANIQAGHIARILSSGNRQYGISRGSLRIAGDIAVNLGIIYLLMGIAAKDARSCQDTTILIYADDRAEDADSCKVCDIDGMLHNLIGSTTGLQVYRTENSRKFIKQHVDDLDRGFRDAVRALMGQLFEITDKVLDIKKKDLAEKIRIKIRKIKEQEKFLDATGKFEDMYDPEASEEMDDLQEIHEGLEESEERPGEHVKAENESEETGVLGTVILRTDLKE